MDPSLVSLLQSLGVVDAETAALLTDLAGAPAEQLVAIREHVRSTVQQIDAHSVTDAQLEELAASAALVKAIGEEFARRNADHAKRREQAQQLVATMTSADADVPPPPDTMSVPSISRLAARRPASHRPVGRLAARPTVVPASGAPADADLPELFGRALAREARDRGKHEGDESRHLVASVRAEWPEERRLGDDEQRNAQLIAAATSREALIASGGVCAPVAAMYELQAIASASRPVRDSLPGFQAARGGIRLAQPATLTTVTNDGAVGVWPEATDASPGNNTKALATFTCRPVVEVLVDAITSRVRLGNFQARYFPEQVEEYLATAMGVHARAAEGRLLASISTGSIKTTTGFNVVGASRELLAIVDRAAAAQRFRHRTEREMPLRLIVPEWVDDLIRADLARSMPGDSSDAKERLAVADREIDQWFATRAINLTRALDAATGTTTSQNFGPQNAGLLLPWPSKVQMWLFPEGSWLFLDGATLDLGFIRDSSLNRTNDTETFFESFEAVAFVGHESLEIVADVCPSGQAAALADTSSDCISGS